MSGSTTTSQGGLGSTFGKVRRIFGRSSQSQVAPTQVNSTINGQQVTETIIEEGKNLNPGQSILQKEMKKFNLGKFFKGKGASTGGIGLITANQSIMADTYIRQQNDSNYGDHCTNFNEVYRVIYGDDVPKMTTANLNQEMVNDGNIAIRFANETYSVILVPENINSYQLGELEKLAAEIDNIYQSDPKYFDKYPMEFTIGTPDQNVNLNNGIDGYLSMLRGEITFEELEAQSELQGISNRGWTTDKK